MASITIRRVVATMGGGSTNGAGSTNGTSIPKNAAKKTVNIRISDRLASRG